MGTRLPESSRTPLYPLPAMAQGTGSPGGTEATPAPLRAGSPAGSGSDQLKGAILGCTQVVKLAGKRQRDRERQG
jgi:hypothetical protein